MVFEEKMIERDPSLKGPGYLEDSFNFDPTNIYSKPTSIYTATAPTYLDNYPTTITDTPGGGDPVIRSYLFR